MELDPTQEKREDANVRHQPDPSNGYRHPVDTRRLVMDRHFANVKVSDLRDICRRNFRMVGREYSSRARIYQSLERQPLNILNMVIGEARKLIGAGSTRYARSHRKQEAQAEEEADVQGNSKRRRLTKDAVGSQEMDTDTSEDREHEDGIVEGGTQTESGNFYMPALPASERSRGSFMVAPDQSIIDTLVAEFIDTTGNDAMKHYPCCSCARDMPRSSITAMKIDDLPNGFVLYPTTPHNSHVLTGGKLLYHRGVFPDKANAYVCSYCLSYMIRKEKPPLSLANDMWIGEVPYQLSNLTLPERLMIAKGFTSAYIVKLFPKQRGATNWDNSQFHSGMKGNISTYKMNPAQMADVIFDNELPHPARILTATIGVTFVGPKGIRESNLPSALRVRRWRVRDALIWLKENNPIYADIQISQDRLDSLPINGVPEEILSVVKYSSDIEALDREHEGYVPEYDEEDEIGCKVSYFFINYALS